MLAARSLRERFNVSAGAKITLTKRIPHGAGLGGGSADAAAALQLLVRLWELSPPPPALEEVALGVGSDVPYFLGEGSAHARSRGEKLTRFHLTLPYFILVVAPRIHVSTADAYASVVPGDHTGSDDLRTLLVQHIGRPDLLRNVLMNDLEAPVFRSHPGVRELKKGLYDSGAEFCLMSGSGSSLFAIFSGAEEALRAADRFGTEHRVFLTRPGFTPDLRISGDRID